jgi:hypothetical protein
MKISRTAEQGGARLKFVMVMAVIGALAYVGYMFVPIAYNAYLFKDLMQRDVDAAAALGREPSWVSEQLSKSASEYGVPGNAVITPVQREGRVEVRVQFTRPIEFPGYTYEYEFDHTVKSTSFITIK